MKMVRPVEVTDSILTSTNVADSTEAVWDSVTAYIAENIVYVAATHHEYECITGNTDVYPPDDVLAPIPKWLDLGATNRWEMFDDVVGTKTTNTEKIEVVIEPGLINTIGLLRVNAATAQVEMVSDSVTVYDRTINLVLDNVNDWYEYFFEPIIRRVDVVFDDLPIYGDGVITVTLEGGVAETIECGFCIPGYWRGLGTTEWGTSGGITDYSTKTTNQFGGFDVVKRGYSKRMDTDIFCSNLQADENQRLLALYRSEPLLWIGSANFQSTIIYGYYRDFDIVLASPAGSTCSLTIEGLI